MPGLAASFLPSPGTHSERSPAPTMSCMPAGRNRPGLVPGGLDALAALGEPTRRALYGFVAAQDRPVSRDEAAAATGIKRATATFHLERLVDDGLLETRFARLSGRTGPGAGRTAKLYARAARQFAVSLPPRRYEIAGEVLASAFELVQCQATPAGEAVAQAAGQAGRQLAAGATDLDELLARSGYEPRHGPGGCIHLANCPFHELVARHAGLVCTMNLHLLGGLLGELGGGGQARLEPADGRCCVTITLP
jgi:predicted ArsR family transcriptional regulator